MRRTAVILVIVFLVIRLSAQTETSANARSLESSALAAWQEYDYATAERLYRQAIAIDPQAGNALAGLIRTLLDEKRLDDAEQSADGALRSAPQSAAVHAAHGDVLFRQGKIESAEAAYRRSLALDANLARGWFGLSRVARLSSNYRSAKHAILKAHDLDPADPDIYDAWASDLPRTERRRAIEHLVDHPGHLDPERLNSLQSRLAWLMVLGNNTAWRLVSSVDSAKLRLDSVTTQGHPRDGTGRVAAPPRVAAVALKVQFNSKKTLSLLLDTGSSGIVLHRNVADKAAIKKIYDIETHGIGDEKASNGYLGWAQAVKIGPIEFQNVPVTALEGNFAEGTDGLIGIDVFEHFLITLDIAKHELELARLPDVPADHRDEDGTSDRYIAAEMQDYLPMLHNGPHVFIPTAVDLQTPGLFFLDTGAFDSQVDSSYVAKNKLTPAPNLTVRGLSGRVTDVYYANQVRIQFGRFVQDNFRMIAISMAKLSEGEGIGLTGILGFPLLSQFRISIDYRDGLVNFEYKGGKR
jgi:tetratricopeptide (TPR) repeat protein